ncbi:hypothetical protein L484_019747 [Morus notabilis]|uniref:Uncharacterized protein n=1 Tax=Morus notabilis TaxID=981085 RepID=W9R1W8_9ROSA|nr:hypothetical protein L484_019747 [Morus notabilis]
MKSWCWNLELYVILESVEAVDRDRANKFNPLNWLESDVKELEDEEVVSGGMAEIGPQSFLSPVHKWVSSKGINWAISGDGLVSGPQENRPQNTWANLD